MDRLARREFVATAKLRTNEAAGESCRVRFACLDDAAGETGGEIMQPINLLGGNNIIRSTLQLVIVIRDSWHGRATKPNPGFPATPGEIRVLLAQPPIAAGLELPGFANDEFSRGHPQR